MLPPRYLEKPERDSLLALFNGLLDQKVSFLIWNFNKHPSVNHLMYGLWQYGMVEKTALMAEAYMRDITRSGEFAETYDHVSPPRPTGVVPSMFGAANIIDAVLWHNGVILCEGLPSVAHVPGAGGVSNLMVCGQPIDVAFDGDRVTIQGRGLQPFKAPAGFQSSLTADGAPCWQGELAVGKQMSLQGPSHPTD